MVCVCASLCSAQKPSRERNSGNAKRLQQRVLFQRPKVSRPSSPFCVAEADISLGFLIDPSMNRSGGPYRGFTAEANVLSTQINRARS